MTTTLEAKDIIKLISTSLIPVSIFAAFLSYKENLNQNRKVQANDEIDKVIDSIQANRKTLNEYIDFSNRTKLDTPLDPYKEIHEWICEKEDGKLIQQEDGLCKMSKDGKEIRAALINIINAFERLAIGVFHLTIDEKLAYDSLGGLVIKNYHLFKEYIRHQREKHGQKKAWEFFEWLYMRWEQNR